MHRAAVALSPIVIGALTVLVQGTSTHVIDPWVIANAIIAGTLTAFINYLRAGSDTPAPGAPK